MGHILGSMHDLDYVGQEAKCAPENGYYVMYPSLPDGPHATEFSPCSSKAILETMSTNTASCMFGSNKPGCSSMQKTFKECSVNYGEPLKCSMLCEKIGEPGKCFGIEKNGKLLSRATDFRCS
jgi:hypothetical protein